MIVKKLFYACFIAVMMTGCEVEFSPNAEWKNIPVVYCLLDQDDDTTWVRVQRCYLGEGSIYNYGQQSDSINYPQGAITVSLLRYSGTVLTDSIILQYDSCDHDTGNFAYMAQPVYFGLTKGWLLDDYQYVLRVRDAVSGEVLATTDPLTLIKKPEDPVITKPANNGMLAFTDVDPLTHKQKYCNIKWKSFPHARLYQPFVRFYYLENGDTLHVDLSCGSTDGTEVNYSIDNFLTDMTANLKDDTCTKIIVTDVDIFVTCCSEELSDYIALVRRGTTLNAQTESFSNIHGGLGVFAARRLKIKKKVPLDNSKANDRLLARLLALPVNFKYIEP